MSGEWMKKRTDTVFAASKPSRSLPGLFSRICRKDVLVAVCLVCAVVLFYWPIVSLRGTMWNDFIEQYFPYRAFANKALRSFTFPFWNPYSFSGIPFFADIQSAVLYPLNLLLVPFGGVSGVSEIVFEYQIVFHVLLAGLFTYILARDFRKCRTASLIAAMSFMLGGFTTCHIFHVTMIHSLPWFVLSFFTLRRALMRRSVLYAVATSFALCFMAFAGHPQMFVYVHYLLGAFLLFHLVEEYRNSRSVKRLIAPTALFLCAVTIGAGLASVQLLPTSRLGRESQRPELDFEKATQGSFRPYRFVTLLAPNFFSRPDNFHEDLPQYWGVTEKDVDPGAHYYWETAMYPGIAPLLLALCALIFSPRSPPVLFLAISAALSFLIAMGDSAPFYRVAYSILPGFRMFRNPARIGVVFTLVTALLAAFGADRIFSKKASETARRSRSKGLIAVAAAIAVTVLVATFFSTGAFRQPLLTFILSNNAPGNDAAQIGEYFFSTVYPFVTRQVWIAALFVCLTICLAAARRYGFVPLTVTKVLFVLILLTDLLMFGYGFAAIKRDPRTIYPLNNLITSIREKYREGIFRINSRGSIPGSDEIGGPYMIFRRNEGSVHGLSLMEGYNPLRLERQLMDRKSRTLDILNVRYKIDIDNSSAAMRIVAHPTCLARARMVHSYRVIRDGAAILRTLHGPEFDHVNEVVLEQKPDFPSGDPVVGCSSSARIVSWGINRIVTEVSTEKPGLLVLSEIHYPAWKATVDGKKAALLRADYALRAIPVSAGTHRVVCEYRDDAFTLGFWISVTSLLLSGAIIAISIRYGKRGRVALSG